MRKLLAVLALILVVAGAAWIVTLILPSAEEERLDVSDATQVSKVIHLGGDGYLGYWFIQSPEMKKLLARRGRAVEVVDDGGAYDERFSKLERGELDGVVAPANSILEHGMSRSSSPVMTAGIAASNGTDGIVGFSDRFPTGTIQELNDASLQIVYVTGSPSEFLINLMIVDFDLFNLAATDGWREEVDSMDEVVRRARNGEGDAFILWAPELFQVLEDVAELEYLWGSDKFDGYIVDYFAFSPRFLRNNADDVLTFLECYFQALRIYTSNRRKLLADMKRSTGLKEDVLEEILAKIDWFDLDENCSRQFGIPSGPGEPAVEGAVNTLIACQEVLNRTSLQENPLSVDPYYITTSDILKQVRARMPKSLGSGSGTTVDFEALTDAQWSRLSKVSTMRVEPIDFQFGTGLLDDSGKAKVDEVARLLNTNYPDYRVLVRGHTGPGDEEENVRLSTERAQVVVQYLKAVHGVDPDRVRTEGKGSSQPPLKKPGESARAYRYRLPRVEFVLIQGSNL